MRGRFGYFEISLPHAPTRMAKVSGCRIEIRHRCPGHIRHHATLVWTWVNKAVGRVDASVSGTPPELDAYRAPVVVLRDVLDLNIPGDAAAVPMGLVDDDGPAVLDARNHGHVAEWHADIGEETQYATAFRPLAAFVDARRPAPPIAGVAGEVDPCILLGKGYALDDMAATDQACEVARVEHVVMAAVYRGDMPGSMSSMASMNLPAMSAGRSGEQRASRNRCAKNVSCLPGPRHAHTIVLAKLQNSVTTGVQPWQPFRSQLGDFSVH